ncbi:MAG: DMT family transporter [Gemmatimonadaceae bacterium]
MKISDPTIGRATILIVLSAFSFGSISVLTVLITRGDVSLLTAMAWRYVLGAVLLALISNVRQLRVLPVGRIANLILIGGCGQALITYISLYALNYIPVGPLAFLFYTYPAWVALLAAVRRTEPLSGIRIIALALALIGVGVMVGAPATEKLHPLGVLLALSSALLYAAYLPTLQQIQTGFPALLSTFLIVIGAGLSFLVTATVASDLHVPKGLNVWTYLFVLAFVSTVIAFSTLIKGLSVLGPVRTSIIATIEPFFTALLGVVVLRNQFSITTIVGGVLIAAAILMIEWSSQQAEAAA